MKIELDVSGLTIEEIEDLRAHVSGTQPGPETYSTPVHGWTCFHCGETFRTYWGARLHFGTPRTIRPACVAEEGGLTWSFNR